MDRRQFLGTTATLAGSTLVTKAVAGEKNEPAVQPYRFKLGMYLPELDLPFDESLAIAKDIGAEYVWFNVLKGESAVGKLSDSDAERVHQRVAQHGLKTFLFSAGNPFKMVHLTDISAKDPLKSPALQSEMTDLTRSMELAKRVGVNTVNCFTFAWPGEYTAGKPTWPMRWATRGGIIADIDLQKLVAIFSEVARRADQHNVNVTLSMMPWNYTNTTGNFRRIVDKVGSQRLKVMWGPADNVNCGEQDVATAGYAVVRPHLYGLHLKDLHVSDGAQLKFDYKPLGEGDVDYVTILKNLRRDRSEAILSVSTHFTHPKGRVEAMKLNYRNLRALISKAEAG